MDRSSRQRLGGEAISGSLDSLPHEVFASLTGLLTGFDLLSLSHVNAHLFNVLLARDATQWKCRVQRDYLSAESSAKEIFARSRSIRFPGCKDGSRNPRDRSNGLEDRGACVQLPGNIAEEWPRSSFSFDIWFALLPSEGKPPNKTGGILFGGQSVPWEATHQWTYYHQQFVLVNDRGDLACSVLSHRPVVKSNLELNRWYHVALTLDASEASSRHVTQRVYVDGELVHTYQGRIHHEWHQLDHFQIGSGCVTGGAPAGPDRSFIGWYGFNGVIDNFRAWNIVLSAEQVERLVLGGDELTDEAQCVWSMKRDNEGYQGPLTRVRCSRPLERVCTLVGNQ